MRLLIKGVAERALVWSGVVRTARSRARGRALILAYHNVVPDTMTSVGDAANHLPLSRFRAQLDSLEATHDIVPLAECLGGPTHSSRPRAAITFDDAYRGALTLAVPELVRRQLPATIFVAPAFIGGKSFWWDELGRPEGGLDDAVREIALNRLAGRSDAVCDWARESNVALAPVPAIARAASLDELAAAAAACGMTIGSHSWSHANLTHLSTDALADDLARSRAWVRSIARSWCNCIAYPYGSHDQRVIDGCIAAGYEGGLAIRGGWVPTTDLNPFAVPRVNIPRGVSDLGFAIRTAGLLST